MLKVSICLMSPIQSQHKWNKFDVKCCCWWPPPLALSSLSLTPMVNKSILSIFIDFEQLVQNSTHIPDCLGGQSNVLDMFLTSHSYDFTIQCFSFQCFSSLGSFAHNNISVSCSIFMLCVQLESCQDLKAFPGNDKNVKWLGIWSLIFQSVP